MFDFLKRRSPSVPIKDSIFLSEETKLEKCKRTLKRRPETVFVAWFDETFRGFQETLELEKGSSRLLCAWELETTDLLEKHPIFVEHYPLRKTEQQVFLKLQLKEATVFSSLDEPIFLKFGGENIAKLMQSLGVNKEAIEHSMITASIRRIQEKIEKKTAMEQRLRSSQEDWFLANLGSNH
ncbi:hypothetical protein DLM76_19875 [Leptospira yasudae]|uniref:hypothetical protein n=1 Tax=Leptospira yasudae TaxID=2202201 RepID=UPI000E59A0E0|nr:hypothetical protein [Leptospira yasudae]RHX91079.1 hypothetical protein DLM76_19875 [Leptospira yasudae]